jgi:peptide/nickel transport system ATP-binding protein
MSSGRTAGRQPDPVLRVTSLRTEIVRAGKTVRVVDGVSLEVAAGECLGLVGESGCGKTMTARSIMRLLPRGGVITAGSVALAGTELSQLSEREMQSVRGRDIGMVFQDPASFLDPTMTIGRQISESVVVHAGADRAVAAGRAVETLAMVRMPDPERVAALYPHHLSGGMLQRAMIAAALACGPRLLIADEPTTALDVTIQRDILELIDDLRRQLGMAVILVTHDLGVISGRTKRVAVMYGGRIVEHADTAAVFADPRHPYTEALLDALPELADPNARSLYSIPGRPPVRAEVLPGCGFAPRCRYASDWCANHEPGLEEDHPGHSYACFFPVGAVTGVPADAVGRRQSTWTTGRARDSAGSPRDALRGNGTRRGLGGRPPEPALPAPPEAPLLQVTGLVKDYPVTRGLAGRRIGAVSAVAGVSFEIAAGQTLGLVGESGCGKTTVARLLVGLEQASEGSIVFRGTELTGLSRRRRRGPGPGIQLMFQDAFASLDPRMRVNSILSEPLAIQKTVRRRGHRRQVSRILEEVGLPPEAASRYPREFSGGQRQRLALARALIQRPALIVADEPVSALDVSVQAQILNLMRKLQRQHNLSYLFISHDLSVVRYMADVIGVMYLGKLVEVGPADDICMAPGHPYTAALIAAVPVVTSGPRSPNAGPPSANGRASAGALPLATEPPSGCRFRTRCPLAADICAQAEPPLRPHAAPGQLVACHFPLAPPGVGSRPGYLPSSLG